MTVLLNFRRLHWELFPTHRVVTLDMVDDVKSILLQAAIGKCLILTGIRHLDNIYRYRYGDLQNVNCDLGHRTESKSDIHNWQNQM